MIAATDVIQMTRYDNNDVAAAAAAASTAAMAMLDYWTQSPFSLANNLSQ